MMSLYILIKKHSTFRDSGGTFLVWIFKPRRSGRASYDIAAYDNSTSGLSIDLNAAYRNSGDVAGDTFIGIEAYRGSPFADMLEGIQGQRDVLDGGAGNDRLINNDMTDVLTGGLGADVFYVDAYDGTDPLGGYKLPKTAWTPQLTHITDFNPGEGDRIDISEYANVFRILNPKVDFSFWVEEYISTGLGGRFPAFVQAGLLEDKLFIPLQWNLSSAEEPGYNWYIYIDGMTFTGSTMDSSWFIW